MNTISVSSDFRSLTSVLRTPTTDLRFQRTSLQLFSLLLLLALPATLHAQLLFVTNNGAITITGYTGAGGAEDTLWET